MLWSGCRSHTSYKRSLLGHTQQCYGICGANLCMQNAGTKYPGQHSTADYLKVFANLTDVQVYNEGLWWNTLLAIHKLENFIQVFTKLPHSVQNRVIWRETSPQHFTKGAWNQWYKREACAPLYSMENPWKTAGAHAEKMKCNVLRVWDLTAGIWTEHLAKKTNHTKIRGYDCTHFCEPGVIDMWSLRLLDMIKA